MIVVLGSVCLAGRLAAQGESSLTESRKENATSRDGGMTAAELLSQNEELKKELSIARESVRTLTDSLAESNLQAEVFRRKYSGLELRMEALGCESADKDRAKLEQRLLSAVSDLQLLQKEREQYRDQSLQLSEAILHLLKTSTGGDAQARMEVEAQLRRTNELVAKIQNAPAQTGTLMDRNVIIVKEESSLVVGNVPVSAGAFCIFAT